MKTNEYVFIVQVARQLCVDILNEFAAKESVELYTGEVSGAKNNLNHQIKVHALCKYNKSSSFLRIITWSWFTLQVFFRLLFKNKKAQLVFITTPPFIPFLGLFFKKIFKQNYHVIVWDLYPEALLSIKNVNHKTLIYRLWKKANKKLFYNAASVITIGENMSKAVSKYTDKKVAIIPNWIDPGFISPLNKSDNWFANKYHQTDKFTILYSGNMGDTHDFSSLLQVAERLKHHQDICFLFIGEGTKKSFIEKTKAVKELDNIMVLPLQEYSVLPFSITTSDVGIVTLEKGMEQVSVPSKMYTILAAGSAVLAIGAKESESGLIVNKYNCGKIFENEDVDGITNFILSLYENKTLLLQFKSNARLAAHNFTPENARLYYSHISST